MIRNYIIISLRNIRKYKAYSLINILGLAIGMTCCLLIMLYIFDELGFDSFHENSGRIYRVAETFQWDQAEITHYPCIGGGVAEDLLNDFPDMVQSSARMLNNGEVWVFIGDTQYREDRVYFADSSLFNVLSAEFIQGNPDRALKQPNTLILSESTAKKYFGDKNAIGQTVRIDNANAPDQTVSGVVKDYPRNSHFHFDILASMSTVRNEQNAAFFNNWYGTAFYTYLLLKEGVSPDALESRFPFLIEKYVSERDRVRLKSIYLQPLQDIHLHSNMINELEPNSRIEFIYIFSAIALLTLIIACINFMNLATARSAGRAREVGLRKVIGADRTQLIKQFIGESLVIAFSALIFTGLFTLLAFPVFNTLSGKELSAGDIIDPVVFTGLLGITLFVGLFSGSYPAFFLSAFQPITILRGKLSSGAKSGMLRKMLVVTQFAVSIALVIGSLLIMAQLDYMKNTDLGFNKDHVVVIPVPLDNIDNRRVQTIELLKQEYSRLPGVESISAASSSPTQIRGVVEVRTTGALPEEQTSIAQIAVDYDYIKTLQINLQEGRDFSPERENESSIAYIFNESAVATLGVQEPLGQEITVTIGQQEVQGTILGTIEDLHYEPMHREIFPMMLFFNPQQFNRLIVRLRPEIMDETITRMADFWQSTIPNRPFEYDFLGEAINNLYQSENRLSGILKYFTLLAIFIACLGLFGLASFTAEQRTKEIGIRKVLGATVSGIIYLLSKEFAKVILIANLFAWPAAYIIMNRWLGDFAYRINMSITSFLTATVFILVIALITMIYQALKAAVANPADSLKYE
ncbi:ABC transporter permease [candidate division KSB1 bacterium]